MAETLRTSLGWNWADIMHDLKSQGGLDIVIDPLTVKPGQCGGKHKNNPFFITWCKDQYLLVTSYKYDQALVNAFSKVVEYKPFVQYKEPETGFITNEWDKANPQERYQELQKEGKLELTKLLE